MEPVSSDTPRDQGNVLDCTGFQNLSHPTHQGTREMYWIVQDVGILRFCHRMLENSGDGLHKFHCISFLLLVYIMMNFFGEISVNYILFCTKGHLSINSKLLSYVLDVCYGKDIY